MASYYIRKVTFKNREVILKQGEPAERFLILLFFSSIFGACRRRTPRTRADLKVPWDWSRRDLSDATARFDLAPRRSPSACAEQSFELTNR